MARRTELEQATPWKLPDHPRLGKGKVVGVVVLDGWGEAPPDPFNCIHVADTPTMDALKKVTSVHRLMCASSCDPAS
jgi:2,3-bisphosphoglycerate-independent phosphoglycerate mutase